MENPKLLTLPLAENGDRNTIPVASTTTGAFTQNLGFPEETSKSQINGGVCPTREDFNGVFYFLSNILFYLQKGKIFAWDAQQDYFTPAVVAYGTDTEGNAILYYCKSDVEKNGSAPNVDTTHWRKVVDYIYDLLKDAKKIQWTDIQNRPTKLSEFSNTDTDFQSGAQVATTVNAASQTINGRIDTEVATLNTTITTKVKVVDDRVTTEKAALNQRIDNEVSTLNTAINGVDTKVVAVEGKIPEEASATNQLADKAFVNSTVQTNTANFRGAWATWTDVPSNASSYPADAYGKKTPTSNDYIAVIDASDYPVGEGVALKGTWRFKYTGVWETNKKNGWLPEYQINREPLTAAQIAALNSGINSDLVAKITTNENNIATNTADIATNRTNITANTSNIATNASNIQTNTADIATNTANITTNANNIASNTAEIATLKEHELNLKPVATVGTYESLLTHYQLPVATAGTLGGVKQGEGVIVDGSGKLSVDTSTIVNAIDWTQLNTSEKLYNNGDSGDILLSNGRVQITTATKITMPVPLSNCATWVTLWCNSGAVTFEDHLRIIAANGDNPQAKGWYEYNGTEYVLTTDTVPIYTSVTPQTGDNPNAKGWYIFINNEYVLTGDRSVVEGRTYYQQKKYFTNGRIYYEVGNEPPIGEGVFVYTLASIGGTGWFCLFTGVYRTN